MNIEEILEVAINRNASDIHLIADCSPVIKINGELSYLSTFPKLSGEEVKNLIFTFISSEQKEIILSNKELDLSFSYQDKCRFRVNVYYQKGTMAASFRLLSVKIPKINELNLPEICYHFSKLKQGFILITGPTGHGKSTTLAAIIEEINQTRGVHIITIEDPIEYIFTPAKSIISQREVHVDTYSWQNALRSCLREDPDVVMIGEMRDYETIASALTIAETGHLVFATLHTNSAAQTIDRVVDVFPEEQQAQIKLQLANTLEAVLSQRLVPSFNKERFPAVEVLLSTPAVRTVIREGKIHFIDNIIQTSGELGMRSLEMDLARLVKEGKISLETAKNYALNPGELMRLLKKN